MRKIIFKNKIFTLILALFVLMVFSVPVVSAADIKGTNLSIGGLIEVEAFHESANATTSGVVAATVELVVDAEINDNVNGHILLLWEEHDPIGMDEATIEITAPYDMVVTLGKLYAPFGVFNSHFVSDPLTLELGEINESAVLISYEKDIFSGSIAIFNGSVDDDDDVIDDFVFSLTATPRDDLILGFSYITDIADTDRVFGLTTPGTLIDKVGGVGLSATFTYDKFIFEAEYVGALEDFSALDLDVDVDGNGDRPSALNLEVAYALSDRLSVAGKYERSAEMFDLPESQIGACASYELFDHTVVAVELLHGEFDLPALEDRSVLTAQIAVEF